MWCPQLCIALYLCGAAGLLCKGDTAKQMFVEVRGIRDVLIVVKRMFVEVRGIRIVFSVVKQMFVEVR